MKLARLLLSSAVLVATAIPCMAMTHPRRGPTSPKLFNKRAKPPARHTGQRAIDDSRASEIQTALIRSGYLSGEPTGHWTSDPQPPIQTYHSYTSCQTQ